MIETPEDKEAFFDSINNNLNENDKQVKTFPQILLMLKESGGYTDLSKLFEPEKNLIMRNYRVSKVITKNLNKIVDINYYPIPETRRSNKLHRPARLFRGLKLMFLLC